MSNDDAQRKMDFILNQQAQFSADIQRLKELNKEAEQRMAQVEHTLTRIASVMLTMAERFTELTAAQLLLDRKMVELAQSQESTDRRLNTLIDIVKGNLNEGS